MVDARFELTTNDSWSVDDAICEGISPLGYWQKVNQSSTQSLITLSLPLNSGILGLRMGLYVPTPMFFYNLWGPRESDSSTICEGISPLGYWQKVNGSPTQTKPYNTLPPFEPRDSWSSYGAVRAYSEVLL